MHEMSIARSILDIVQEEVARNEVKQLVAINIAVGKLSAVVPQQLAFCFSMISVDTNLARATLNIREVPLGYMCGSCREEFASEEMSFICPACGEKNPHLITGKELTIESIEVAD